MDKIYALYIVEDGTRNYFYVGRAKDPFTRFKQHLSDKSNTDRAKLIQYCKKQGIELGYEVVCSAQSSDAETRVYWQYWNQGYTLLNQIECNSNRSEEFFDIEKKACNPMDIATLKSPKKWYKHLQDGKKKSLNTNGWAIVKASYTAGNYIEIHSDRYPLIKFYDYTFKWSNTYKAVIEITNALLAEKPLPKLESINYNNQ